MIDRLHKILYSLLLGSTALVPASNQYLLNQRIGLITPKEDCRSDKKYLYYLFNTSWVRQQIRNSSSGTKVRHTSPERIYKVQVNVPDLKKQKKIAAVLSAYDDLIENNNRRIALLEKMAEEIYREWFVRLRFPGHEQVARHKGIPERWELVKLDELGFVGRGKSKHRPRNDPSLYGGDYPFIQTGEVKEFSSHFYITSHIQTYNKRGVAQSKLWDAGTLLITIAANIAETAILTYPACMPDSIIGFVADTQKVSAEYIKYSIEHLKLSMQSISQGTTQDNLSQKKLLAFKFLVPSQEIMDQFSDVSQPLFSKIKTLLFVNKNLQRTRDRLLPRLISGKLSVEDLDIQFPLRGMHLNKHPFTNRNCPLG